MKHLIEIRKKPVLSGKDSSADGAITGNGDLAVILGNAPCGLRIYLSKTDIFYAAEQHGTGGLRPLGCIDVPVPAADYDNYYACTDIDNAVITCRFGQTEIEITVPATENAVILKIKGGAEPSLGFFEGQTDGEKGAFSENGADYIFRSFAGGECAYETHCFAGMKKVGEGLYYLCAATNHNTEDPRGFVTERVSKTDEARIAALEEAHADWWKSFREKSGFVCENSSLELGWHVSQFYIAVARGYGSFPPGLFANFITVERPAWKSDYHLNYNYQAPFYGVFSSNHPELSDAYMSPLEEFVPRGREFAKRFGAGGVILPVGIAPKGLCSEIQDVKYPFERLFLGQKSNGIHPADIAVFRWYATRDTEYAREHAYPYIKEALKFFEDYAVFEDGRYSVCDDAAHEVPMYRDDFEFEKYPFVHDKNNTVTLGLLKMTLNAALDMAQTLGVDEDRQEKWKDMLTHLSPFPTTIRHGRRVFRYTEKGQRWHGDNDVGLQHLFPCDALAYMDSRETKIALNTFNQRRGYCFCDGNAVSSYFPMAARLKINPRTIIKKLAEFNAKRMMSNMLYRTGAGGLEYCSVYASTLNEMVLQSFRRNIIEIFPCWDRNTGCAFNHLLANGAVLVSSEMKNGAAVKTTLEFTKGSQGKITVTMPAGDYRVTGAEYEHEKAEKGRTAFVFDKLAPGTVIEIN